MNLAVGIFLALIIVTAATPLIIGLLLNETIMYRRDARPSDHTHNQSAHECT